MAQVVELSSKRMRVDECLQDVCKKLDAGTIEPSDRVMVILEKRAGGLELCENGLTIAQCVYMLEQTKYFLLTIGPSE